MFWFFLIVSILIFFNFIYPKIACSCGHKCNGLIKIILSRNFCLSTANCCHNGGGGGGGGVLREFYYISKMANDQFGKPFHRRHELLGWLRLTLSDKQAQHPLTFHTSLIRYKTFMQIGTHLTHRGQGKMAAFLRRHSLEWRMLHLALNQTELYSPVMTKTTYMYICVAWLQRINTIFCHNRIDTRQRNIYRKCSWNKQKIFTIFSNYIKLVIFFNVNTKIHSTYSYPCHIVMI